MLKLHTTIDNETAVLSYYSDPDRKAGYCDERVCPSIRLSARISQKPQHQMPPNYLCLLPVTVRGSVLPWRRSNTLCTSGFVECRWRHVCYDDQTKATRVGRKLEVTRKGAALIWHIRSKCSNWLARGQHRAGWSLWSLISTLVLSWCSCRYSNKQ